MIINPSMQRKDFASDEEFQVYNWLKEAETHHLVRDIVYQPGPFKLAARASVKVPKRLKTKTKIVDKFLLHPHQYTPDFAFTIVSKALEGVFKFPDNDEVIIDTKGGFNAYGDPKQFSINQKWMWQRYGIFVEKVVPEKLFKKTWVPEICRLSPIKRHPVKKYIGVPVIGEFLQKVAA